MNLYLPSIFLFIFSNSDLMCLSDMSNPYWQKNYFYRRHPDLLPSSDLGMDPLASTQITSTDIESPEIASAEITTLR